MNTPETRPNAEASTNHVFDFYSNLCLFLDWTDPSDKAVETLLELYGAAGAGISLAGVTKENLWEWHKQTLDENEPLEGAELMAESAFRDLVAQMRNERVRDLFKSFKKLAVTEDDLFVHVRRVKDLGDGVAAATIVVDDIELFRELHTDPQAFFHGGKIHFSESLRAEDPGKKDDVPDKEPD